MEYILIDTGVWIALFDRKDQHRKQAEKISEYFELFHLILPWPTLYETLRTKIMRRPRLVRDFDFEGFLKRPSTSLLDDGPYRGAALEMCFESVFRKHRPLSLVDCLIRLILEDRNVKITSLATFNYADFSDVCQQRRIEILM
jgi:predicted nucleic acid-binding protein